MVEATETYYLVETGPNPNVPTDYTHIETVEQLVALTNNYDLELLQDVAEGNYVASFDLPVEQINAALTPVVEASKEYFRSKGFTDGEILEMLDGEHESTLVPVVMALTLDNEVTVASNIANVFFQSAYAKGFRECFVESTGIAAGVALIGAMGAAVIDKTLVKTLVMQAVKKIGLRTLGGIGIALIVIDISICMY